MKMYCSFWDEYGGLRERIREENGIMSKIQEWIWRLRCAVASAWVFEMELGNWDEEEVKKSRWNWKLLSAITSCNVGFFNNDQPIGSNSNRTRPTRFFTSSSGSVIFRVRVKISGFQSNFFGRVSDQFSGRINFSPV